MLEIILFTISLLVLVILCAGGTLWVVNDFTDDELEEIFNSFDNNIFR